MSPSDKDKHLSHKTSDILMHLGNTGPYVLGLQCSMEGVDKFLAPLC